MYISAQSIYMPCLIILLHASGGEGLCALGENRRRSRGYLLLFDAGMDLMDFQRGCGKMARIIADMHFMIKVGVMMTRVFFVRHAQPDGAWPDDRTKPLTALGMEERKKVTDLLSEMPIDVFISSPYKRSMDTIAACAELLKMDIHTDERFRERRSAEGGYAIDLLQRRWDDFHFHEKGGESLHSVQSRNIDALNEMLAAYENKTIVIGTHGTALSTIINYYDSSFGCEGFIRIWHCMPYVIRLDFEDKKYIGREELLMVESFH